MKLDHDHILRESMMQKANGVLKADKVTHNFSHITPNYLLYAFAFNIHSATLQLQNDIPVNVGVLLGDVNDPEPAVLSTKINGILHKSTTFTLFIKVNEMVK